MIELAIGTRFRCNGSLCKVVEVEYEYNRCSECDMVDCDCIGMACASVLRQDKKEVCFKWVEE